MYNRILVPTDGSKPATEAAEHGFTLAKQFGATVHILYIIEVGDSRTLNTYGGIDASLLSEDGMASIEKEAAEVVERLETRANELGIETVTEIEQGSARQDIINYVSDHDIELIVMGTHGRSGVERFLLGSVTERVIRTADVPVFVVRSNSTSEINT